MSVVMRVVGVAVTLGLIIVSLVMNFRFGQSLGRTEMDGLVYGLASACADGFKVVLPFAIMSAWHGKRRIAAGAAAALWLVFTAYSMTSSLGHSSVNRAETAGERRHQIADYKDLRRQIELKLKEREALPSFRPIATLEADIKSRSRDYRYERSQGCNQIERMDVTYCEGVAKLEAERGIARRAGEIEKDIERMRAELSASGSSAKSEQSDAQTAMIREVTGVAEHYVRLALTVLVSIMIELGSGLGLYVVLGRRETNIDGLEADAGTEPGRAARWLRLFRRSAEDAWFKASVSQVEDAYANELELYRDYCLWIVKNGRGPALTLGDFRDWLSSRGLGEPMRKRGRMYYAGVRLRMRRAEDGRDNGGKQGNLGVARAGGSA